MLNLKHYPDYIFLLYNSLRISSNWNTKPFPIPKTKTETANIKHWKALILFKTSHGLYQLSRKLSLFLYPTERANKWLFPVLVSLLKMRTLVLLSYSSQGTKVMFEKNEMCLNFKKETVWRARSVTSAGRNLHSVWNACSDK